MAGPSAPEDRVNAENKRMSKWVDAPHRLAEEEPI